MYSCEWMDQVSLVHYIEVVGQLTVVMELTVAKMKCFIRRQQMEKLPSVQKLMIMFTSVLIFLKWKVAQTKERLTVSMVSSPWKQAGWNQS